MNSTGFIQTIRYALQNLIDFVIQKQQQNFSLLQYLHLMDSIESAGPDRPGLAGAVQFERQRGGQARILQLPGDLYLLLNRREVEASVLAALNDRVVGIVVAGRGIPAALERDFRDSPFLRLLFAVSDAGSRGLDATQ